MKERRNKEIKSEKHMDDQFKKMDEIEGEEDGDTINPLKSREKYKEERLQKIKDLRYQEGQTTAPTMEELKSKPSLNDIRTRPLIKRDENLSKGQDDSSYM